MTLPVDATPSPATAPTDAPHPADCRGCPDCQGIGLGGGIFGDPEFPHPSDPPADPFAELDEPFPRIVLTDGDPYAEGREAHDAGQAETANPYDPEADEDAHGSWMDGWNQAVEAATDDAMEADDAR